MRIVRRAILSYSHVSLPPVVSPSQSLTMYIVRSPYKCLRAVLRRGTFPPLPNFVIEPTSDFILNTLPTEDSSAADHEELLKFHIVRRNGTWELDAPQRSGIDITSSFRKANVVSVQQISVTCYLMLLIDLPLLYP
jgi:hypothetical protein